MFHSIQYRDGWSAASGLFDMFTQSIKFYTFHYQYRCLKNVIHQIDKKNKKNKQKKKKWMVAPFSKFYGKILVSFYLNTGKRFFLEVSFSSQQKEHRFF